MRGHVGESDRREARPKVTGREARPKVTGREARPKVTGREARPKVTGREARPEVTGREVQLGRSSPAAVRDDLPLCKNGPTHLGPS